MWINIWTDGIALESNVDLIKLIRVHCLPLGQWFLDITGCSDGCKDKFDKDLQYPGNLGICN